MSIRHDPFNVMSFDVGVGFLGGTVTVRADDQGLSVLTAEMFRMMPEATDGPAGEVTASRTDSETYRVTSKGFSEEVPDIPIALKRIRQCTLQRFIDYHADLTWIHAGAVAIDNHVVLLVGRWGSGKSSIVRSLCQRGAKYLSDDVVPFRHSTGRVTAYPIEPANRIVQTPGVSDRSAVAGHAKEVWAPGSVGGPNDWFRPVAIVFPEFDASDSRVRIREVAAAEAARDLVQQCFSLGSDVNNALGSLTGFLRGATRLRIAYRTADESADALLRLLKQP